MASTWGLDSQLIYNRQSGLSLFLGALSADRFAYRLPPAQL